MDLPGISLDHLASRLEPFLASVLREGQTFTDLVGHELPKKALGGMVTIGANIIQSIGKAAWKTIKSSKVQRKYHKRCQAAQSEVEREQAIRDLLAEDPKCAQSLFGLLLRLDFLRAVAEHAEHLPNIDLIDAARRLSEVYVPLRIEPLGARYTSRPVKASSQRDELNPKYLKS